MIAKQQLMLLKYSGPFLLEGQRGQGQLLLSFLAFPPKGSFHQAEVIVLCCVMISWLSLETHLSLYMQCQKPFRCIFWSACLICLLHILIITQLLVSTYGMYHIFNYSWDLLSEHSVIHISKRCLLQVFGFFFFLKTFGKTFGTWVFFTRLLNSFHSGTNIFQ